MFRLDIRDGFCLKLLEERHAPAIFALVNRDRKYLRKWLPWVDLTKQVDDTLKFVKITLAQFANNEGLCAGSGAATNLQALSVRIRSTG